MKTFSIYEHLIYGFKAVKQGWSWPAFLFAGIWVIVKGLWEVLFLTFGLCFLFSLVSVSAKLDIGWLIPWVISIVYGIMGNQWLEGKLQKKGWRRVDTAHGSSPNEAVMTYRLGIKYKKGEEEKR